MVSRCTKAFKASKDLIRSAKVLAHYDPMLPLKLAADASAYGLGAVISHMELALVFGVQNFHQYLYGRKFRSTSFGSRWGAT